jgi:hypothetical protein
MPKYQQPELIASTVPVPDPTKLTTDAVALLKDQIINIMDLRFDAIRDLYTEKFKGVATEFTMRDIALAAAFKAAEAQVKQQNESNTLAIDKAGTAFTKQIDGLDEKINDLKERMALLSTGHWSAVGGYLIGIVGAISIILYILSRTNIHP